MKRKLFIIFVVVFLVLLLAVGVSATDEYDSGEFDLKSTLIISVVVGAVIALIVVNVMKGQLKSVRKESGAGNYIKAGSFNLTRSNDFFLYRTVTKNEKPKSNTGTSRSRGRN